MKKFCFYILILLFGSTGLFAQLDRSQMPEPGPAPEIELGSYETFTLDNGLKVFVVENHKLPRVSFSLQIDRDPILEGENAGYISCAGDLMRRGTKTMTKDELDEAIDFIGARLSASSTGVFGSSLKQHTDKLLGIMSDIVKNADFKQEELDKIKTQLKSGLAAQKDNPTAIAGNVRQAVTYGKDHPYGEQITEETVENIDLEMCKEYYNTYFRPNISYMAVVGDIDKDEAEDLLEEYFGDWEKADVPAFTYETPEKPVVRKVALVDRAASVQSVIHLTYPIQLHKGSEEDIEASVLNTILGGGFASRLNQNLREDKAWTYGARSSIADDKLVGSFDAYTEARNSVTDSVVTEMIDEMEKLREEPVSDSELELAINYMTGNFSRSLESPGTIASFAINTEKYDLPEDYYQNYLKNLADVSAADVQDVAKKYLTPDKAYVVVVGNGEDVAENLKQFTLSGNIDYYDIYGNKVDPNAAKAPEGLTAEKVIEDYLEAVGGREELAKVQDRTQVITGSTMGQDLKLTIYSKVPNLLKQVLTAGPMEQVTVYNGETGKMRMMGQEVALEGDKLEELKLQATLHLYLNLDELGITTKLVGVEPVGSKDAYKLELTLPNGAKWYHYFDKETGYKVQEVSTMDTPQGSFTQTIIFSNFQEVEGVMYPFTFVQNVGPQSTELNVQEIKVNTGLEDSFFTMD